MPFNFIQTKIENLIVIEPKRFGDNRGFYMETYKKDDFYSNGITEEFIQDNHSCSSRGVIRGIHFQKNPMAQGKLVRVITGSVWDLAVDLRKESPTFGQWFGVELSGENGKMLYIPAGFGHGFLTMEDNTNFVYKCTKYYSPEYESGIIWNDPDLAIKYPLIDNVSFSSKDGKLPRFKDIFQ